MRARAAALAIAAVCAMSDGVELARAQGVAATARADDDARDAADAFRAIRTAEVEGDAARVRAIADGAANARIAARAALAVETLRLRGAARTVADAVAAEREIERLRGALIEKLEQVAKSDNAADLSRCARELALESAEDLLLRQLTLGARDALVAAGLPSAEERRDAEALRAAVEARLASDAVAPMFAADAAIATDAAAFRAHALKGLAALLDADLAQCEALVGSVGERGDAANDMRTDAKTDAAARARSERSRAAARALLVRANLCELPIPRALGDILALARGRAETDPVLRDRLLARAVDSADAATAFVARVTRWQDGGRRGPFPSPPADTASAALLTRIACAAELRASAGPAAAAETFAAPIERFLRRAAAESRDPSVSAARLRAAADWLAERLPSDARALAARDDAPAALFAVAALGRGGDAVIDRAPAAATRAATDPLVGPAIAVRIAERQASRGETDAAARTIIECVRAFDGLPAARDAMAIALDIRRAAGDATALDAALELAIARFASDSAANGWRFERVDLALHGPARMRDLARAAAILDAMPKRDLSEADRSNLFLRQIELEFARASDATPPRTAAARETLVAEVVELGKTATALDVQALAAAGGLSSPRHEQTLPARMAAIRAEIALFTDAPLKACLLAERAYGDPFADDGTALRAAKAWTRGALAAGEPVKAPAALRAFAARSAAFRGWIDEPAQPLLESTEAALAEGSTPKNAPGALETLGALAAAGSDAPNAHALRVQALGRLAALDGAGAEKCAREALRADGDDRLAQWILAEVLRAKATREGGAEAFALYRALSPIAATDRDRFWWRGQLAQLEMLLAAPERAAGTAEIVARVNRLAALDPTMGGPALARRFESVRKQALAGGRGDAAGATQDRQNARIPRKD